MRNEISIASRESDTDDSSHDPPPRGKYRDRSKKPRNPPNPNASRFVIYRYTDFFFYKTIILVEFFITQKDADYIVLNI